MTTLTIPAARVRDDVLPGDVIQAIDGRPLTPTLTVADRPWDIAGAVRLVNRLGTDTVWNLYPDTQVTDDVTVVRATRDDAMQAWANGGGLPYAGPPPAPNPDALAESIVEEALAPKPKRPATRLVAGIRLVAEGDGRWRSEDGRYEITRDDDCYAECDKPHPMRMTPALADAIGDRSWLFPHEALWAVTTRARGYLCPGGCEHTESLWIAWDTLRNDHVGGSGPGSFVTFADVLDHFRSEIERGWGTGAR